MVDDRQESGSSGYRLIQPVGSCFHADLHLAEWAAATSFAKRITVWRVRPELTADVAVKALLLEDLYRARALSFWSLCNVLDVWEGAAGVALATEHVSGTSLAEAARAAARRSEALPLGTVLTIFLELARGLTSAHDPSPSGGPLVHGDLRPDWVLVGHDGQVKLTGFGFGRFLSTVSPDGQWCVWDGRCYQAPERLDGEHADPRSDVFSLGVMLLEATTGTMPYGTDEPAWLLSLLRARTSPIPPGGRDLPDDVADVIRRACAPEPSDRYPTVEALAADLHGLLATRHLGPDTNLILGALESLSLSPAAGPDDAATRALLLPGSADLRLLGPEPGPRLLGRDEVLEVVSDALGRAAAGTGEAILVSGEPGMGRSRLLREVQRRLAALKDRQVAFLGVSPHPAERRVSYAGVLRLLAAAVGLDPRCDLVEVAEEADRLRAFGVDSETIAALRGVLGMGDRPEPARLAGLLAFAALRCLSSLSWERPTVVAWDDLDETDAASLRCLAELLERVAGMPVVALLTATREFDPGFTNSEITRAELGPLSRAECATMAAALAEEAREVDSALLDELLDRSGGNPLLIVELVELLRSSGRLVVEGECLRCVEAGGPLPSLDDAVRERLAQLPEATRRVAVAAAVAGPGLCDRVVSAATGVPLGEAGDALLDLASSERLLRRGPGGLEFAHERIRRAVEASALPGELELIRERTARAILDVWEDPAEGLDDFAASLLVDAGDLARASAVLLDRAGRQEQRGDVRGATDRYLRGLALARRSGTVTPEGELSLCLQAGRAALGSFALDDAEATLSKAVELADRVADPAAGAEARVLLCRVLTRAGRFQEAMDRAREAMPLAEQSGERLILAEVHAAIGEGCQQWGHYGPDIEHIDHAVTIATEEGDLRSLGEYLNLAVLHAAGVGHSERTWELLERARRVAEASPTQTLDCQLGRAEGQLLTFVGEVDRALEVHLAGVERARELGLTELEVMMLHACGDSHMRLGHPREAHFYFTESLRRARAARFDRLSEANEMYVGYLEATWLGVPEGLDRLEAAVERSRRLGRMWNLTQGRTLLGAALLAKGERHGAIGQLTEAVNLARQAGVRFFLDQAQALLDEARKMGGS